MDAFRDAILQRAPIETFALKTVQHFIQPQKQTKLAQDENQMLENMLRTLLQELVAAAAQSGEQIMQYGQLIDDDDDDDIHGQIPHLLDVVLYLCEKEHVEGGMIFQLLEDLTEMSTMKNCKDVFGYIESKQDILGKVFLKRNQIFSRLVVSCILTWMLQLFAARAFCTRKTCHVEDLQPTSPPTLKGQ
jgi:THO complex subunit 1